MSANLEEVILGAILDAEGPVLQTSAGLLVEMTGMRPEDFSDARARVAWRVVARLAARRRPVDALSVYAAGRTTKLFGEDDLAWLQGLQHANSLDRERFSTVVEGIRVQARSKQLETALEEQLRVLRSGSTDIARIAGDLDSTLKEIISAAEPDATGEDDVLEVSNDWDLQESGAAPPTLCPTGLPVFDELLGGWMQNLNIVGGLPSVGKSALLASCIDGQTAAGLKVGLFGLEDGTKWLARRVIAREMALPVRSVGFAKRTPEQAAQFGDVGARVSAQLRNLVTYRRSGLDVREMLRRAASWVRNRGVQCIWLDHGGELDHSAEGTEDQMAYRVARSYTQIRDFAVDYGVPFVVMAHTKRPFDGNEQRPPQMVELSDSSKIEKAARVFVGVWRKYSEPESMRATIVKATEGETGVTARIQRWKTAALLNGADWERIDLQKEAAMEARLKREAKEAERAAAAEATKQKRAAAKAQKTMFAKEDRDDAE
jgi:replicative DNA helicase